MLLKHNFHRKCALKIYIFDKTRFCKINLFYVWLRIWNLSVWPSYIAPGVGARDAIESTNCVVLLFGFGEYCTSCTLLTSYVVILALQQTLVFSILAQYLHVLMKLSFSSWKKYETDISHSFKWNVKPIWVALFKCSQLTAALLEMVDYLGHKSWRQIDFNRSGTTSS